MSHNSRRWVLGAARAMSHHGLHGVLGAALLLSSGCYERRPRADFSGDTSLSACPTLSGAAPQLSIDADQPFPSDPGSGVAIYLEYMSGGHWSVRPQCDTALTGETCAFDVTAQVWNGSTFNVLGDNLENTDAAGSVCADTAFLSAVTAGDVDRLFFDTSPGATVRFTATLGNARYPDLFYWQSGGASHSDAGGDPVDVTPSAP